MTKGKKARIGLPKRENLRRGQFPAWELYFEERSATHIANSLTGRSKARYLWLEQDGNCLVCRQPLTPVHFGTSTNIAGESTAETAWGLVVDTTLVREGRLKRLEPYAGKLARAVLGGETDAKVNSLARPVEERAWKGSLEQYRRGILTPQRLVGLARAQRSPQSFPGRWRRWRGTPGWPKC